MEAPPGFEPGMEVLQTSALPLGDGADRDRCSLFERLHLYKGSPVVSRPDEQGGQTTPDGGDTEPRTRLERPLAGGRVGIGAGNGIRTRDFDLGKVALYH